MQKVKANSMIIFLLKSNALLSLQESKVKDDIPRNPSWLQKSEEKFGG